LSFGKLADIYVREYCELNTKASTATETARLLSKAAAFLGNKPVREITEADIVDLLALPPEKAGKFAGLAAKTVYWPRSSVVSNGPKRPPIQPPVSATSMPIPQRRSQNRSPRSPAATAIYQTPRSWRFGRGATLLVGHLDRVSNCCW
jgi:hypothetical protein